MSIPLLNIDLFRSFSFSLWGLFAMSANQDIIDGQTEEYEPFYFPFLNAVIILSLVFLNLSPYVWFPVANLFYQPLQVFLLSQLPNLFLYYTTVYNAFYTNEPSHPLHKKKATLRFFATLINPLFLQFPLPGTDKTTESIYDWFYKPITTQYENSTDHVESFLAKRSKRALYVLLVLKIALRSMAFVHHTLSSIIGSLGQRFHSAIIWGVTHSPLLALSLITGKKFYAYTVLGTASPIAFIQLAFSVVCLMSYYRMLDPLVNDVILQFRVLFQFSQFRKLSKFPFLLYYWPEMFVAPLLLLFLRHTIMYLSANAYGTDQQAVHTSLGHLRTNLAQQKSTSHRLRQVMYTLFLCTLAFVFKLIPFAIKIVFLTMLSTLKYLAKVLLVGVPRSLLISSPHAFYSHNYFFVGSVCRMIVRCYAYEYQAHFLGNAWTLGLKAPLSPFCTGAHALWTKLHMLIFTTVSASAATANQLVIQPIVWMTALALTPAFKIHAFILSYLSKNLSNILVESPDSAENIGKSQQERKESFTNRLSGDFSYCYTALESFTAR